MVRIWDDILSEQDIKVIEKAGYSQRGAVSWESRGLGQRPILLVIDMQELSCGPDVPILHAIEHYRTAMGNIAWAAISRIESLLETAREVGVPIIYTRVIPRGYRPDQAAVQIVLPLAPRPDETVIDKQFASAFYGTSLLNHLVRRGADTIVLVGNSTSGCIRATAVDAQQTGFNVVVTEDCVFDRIQASHKASLLDLWMKYAVVMSASDVSCYLRSLSRP
ncbi:MAG: isochorismatase family protein [Chloroflexota bacterium]